jgi:hypothetical protein
LDTRRVSLVNIDGPTSIRIDAEITAAGDLLLSGQDIGQAPSECFGDSDYEYWLTIPAASKDDVLLAVIQALYSGNASLMSELKEFLEARGIPCKFDSYA